MLEQQIKLLESYLNGEDVNAELLISGSIQAYRVSIALLSLEAALEEAYRGDKEYAAIRFQEFKDDMAKVGKS